MLIKKVPLNINDVLRYVALALSTGAMVLGVLVMVGTVHINFPDQFRVVVGAVVFLYGGYRFAISYYRNPHRSGEDHDRFR